MLLPSILGEATFFVFILGLSGDSNRFPVKAAMDSLFEDLEFFLNSPLSFLESGKEEDLLR